MSLDEHFQAAVDIVQKLPKEGNYFIVLSDHIFSFRPNFDIERPKTQVLFVV